MKKRYKLIGALVAATMGLVSCSKEGSNAVWQESGKAKVVATSTMVTDMVKIIGGDQVEVYGMMKEGVDPHSYEQTAKDVAAMNSADVIFYSGLHLEGHVQEGLERRAEKGNVYAVTDGISKDSLIKPQDDYMGYADPHVWGDPELWAKTVPVVVEGLSKHLPEHAEEFKKRGKAYQKELLDLKAWAKARVSEIPENQRVLVTSHDAFFYFGSAFDFEVKGLQGVSTDHASSVKDVDDLVSFIKERGLKTIFPESSVNQKGLETVANRSGVKLSAEELFSDAMGKVGDVVEVNGEKYDRGTYIGMQKHNINTIVEGLK
ncbi:manganese-binding lipoprotein MntA [Rubritalea halochordaticola]|uniref:Manganese-binding lipoprotein MntA n=1 Tax=Rubritalea halochordaticola TaxID=714537 RepID=A0ABP9UV63_9BACT